MVFDIRKLFPHRLRVLPRRNPPKRLRTFTRRAALAGGNRAKRPDEAAVFHRSITLRMGRMTRFAAVGALGTAVNLLIMALLVHGEVGIGYAAAAVVAAEISILHNFLLQERFVFRDMRERSVPWRSRLAQHLVFNNIEAVIRLPFLILLVETMHVLAVLAQAATLAAAFITRFFFTSRVVYRPLGATQKAHHHAAGEHVGELSS